MSGDTTLNDFAYVPHLAPEVYLTREYSVASDIYGAGVTLYRLVNGDSFLPSISPAELRQQSIEGKFPNRKLYRDFIPRQLRSIINKAMNVDPTSRFASAEEMRHSLEQVKIEMNWREKALTNGSQWTCGWGDRIYEVSRTRADRHKWNLEVKKGRSKETLRRYKQLCAKNLSKKAAEQQSRRILQDFVTGKLR